MTLMVYLGRRLTEDELRNPVSRIPRWCESPKISSDQCTSWQEDQETNSTKNTVSNDQPLVWEQWQLINGSL